MKMPVTLYVVLCSALLSMVCTPSGTSGVTESTNQFVAGMLYEPDGSTPADGARVIIRPRATLPMIAGIVSELSDGLTDTVVTDRDGRYAFSDTLKAGEYSIEARKGTNAAFISSVHVPGGNEPVVIDPDTLKPAGTITGSFFLAGGGDPTEIYVLAFGCDRFTQAKGDGTFTFNDLGEGEYHLKIITTLDNYSSFDTSGISVRSEAATDLGTITLPFSGVPIVQQVNAVWDTPEYRAILSWERVSSKAVKYYNVYVWNGPTATTGVYQRINSYQITDTFYIDNIEPAYSSLASELQTPSRMYSVAAVDSNENESRLSAAPPVTVVQSFTVSEQTTVRTLIGGKLQDVCITGDGTFLIASANSTNMHFLDTTLTHAHHFIFKPYSDSGKASPLPYIPAAICTDKVSGIFYFVRPSDFTIDIFRRDDTIGTFIDSIDDPTVKIQGVTDCEVIGGDLYILTGGDSLLCFDNSYKRRSSWYCGAPGKGTCIAAGGNRRVVIGMNSDSCDACWYDSTGTLLSKDSYGMPSPLAITVDTLRQHVCILTGTTHSNGRFKMVDGNNNKLGSFDFIDWGGNAIFLHPNGDPLVVLGTFFYSLVWYNR